MTWLYIALGGAAGASLRHAATLLLAPLTLRAGWPLGVLLINLLGSLLLGLLLGLVGRGVLPEAARLALGTGLLGGFTTFSTFSVDLDQLLARGAYGEAALYLGFSVGGGVLAAVVGRLLAQQL
ncbi:CrcB-like protein [Deinococcus proteolyticus MRP]|uniref:Fluoride-specific ion channel FluC n=1 Tax=Deinococcus proteolyticus (strain ATCC 35074 / DSM 20540 / JCM 6276 / NBRC 101906 / NCIMB 13154 / VKM Ac-1939 / CCM 2703 / MRP) TaxID=693977 RepID=F0RJH9_DEIPM|nr:MULTISPECIES: fluoride efflux transporter CrcB [Deinococcus]ADY25520.1 CrcB-like protein [Deinococcus proteolyticus MRP]MCY1701640.1 fluoride efflux transporter CrcB [Deinococcus sp. SL84]